LDLSALGDNNNNNNNSNNQIPDSIEKFAKALNFIEGKKNENSITQHSNYLRKYNLLRADVYKQLADLSHDFPSVTVAALTANKLDHVLNNSKNVSETLYQQALQYYQTAVSICQQQQRQPSLAGHRSQEDQVSPVFNGTGLVATLIDMDVVQ
jgi:hypothetical protein